MTQFPAPVHTRLLNMISGTRRLAEKAHQRLNTVGSQVNSLQPGDWNLLELNSGWSSTSGFVPAQTRLQQTGVTWLVGHIEGGDVSDGTVIGSLSPGFFNETHSHSFTANVVSGADAVPVAGALGDLAGDLTNYDWQLFDLAASGPVSGTTASVTMHNGLSQPVQQGLSLHNGATATPVNYNTALLTIDPSGNVTLSNCPAAASQISFSEFLPLNTS